MCNKELIHILVIQETHRGPDNPKPKIGGMNLVIDRSHNQYGSAIFAKPDLIIYSASLMCNNNLEILTIELQSCTVTSIYKPPPEVFKFDAPDNFNNKSNAVIIGDFNSHSITWGYNHTDDNGEKVESWAENQSLKLVHDPKLPGSFNSRRWKASYNPDLIFASDSISNQCTKSVLDPLPRTQHRPISCKISSVVKPESVPFKRRFNFKKAKWQAFASELDQKIVELKPEPESYETFVSTIKKVSCRHIPRGCRTQYIPGLNGSSKEALKTYQQFYENDPFSEDTIEAGENLLHLLTESKKERWCSLIESLDMKQNSRRAWKLVNNLNQEPNSTTQTGNVTPNQIANQLTLNGKSKKKPHRIKIQRDTANENHFLDEPFTMPEYVSAVNTMKQNKAAGPDDIRTEQIKQFGPVTNKWILDLFNNIMNSMQIPKLWRKSHVIALLKPGKEPSNPKSYRPISLLCHLFKVMERMVLNRILPTVDENFIPEQAGFRPGRSCCGQILNLTQHIEDGFERKETTGVVFVDLTAAYDTVNHKRLVSKVYRVTKDFRLTNFVRCILESRKFYVTLKNQNSRWKFQKNGLPQGSVLAPLLFNVYTNDQPMDNECRKFIYADDTAVAAQGVSYEEVEGKLNRALSKLTPYYEENQLKPNPLKTEVCAFHLRHIDSNKKLKVIWSGQELNHNFTPRYLGVTLDRTLTFKKHCQNTKLKVSSRNNILRKLTGTSWGAQPHVLRTSAIALSLAAAEYSSPVWKSSVHSKNVNIAINESCRIITGCLKPTPLNKIYSLSGIAPPNIRRIVAAEVEKTKQATDNRHPLYGHILQPARLKSRKSFLRTTCQLSEPPETRRLQLWNQQDQHPLLELKEELPPGADQSYITWKTLNRLRSGVSCCKYNMKMWGYEENANCTCGSEQRHEHLFVCNQLDETCTLNDLLQVNERALKVANHWRRKI